MLDLIHDLLPRPAPALIRYLLFIFGAFVAAHQIYAQDTPLVSGGVAFLTSTNAGNTTYMPIVEPLLAAPLGQHILIESRAALLESFAPNGGNEPGYGHSHFIGFTYLQGDIIASRYFTIVGGDYLLPFNTYNERLSPVWIGNFVLMGYGTGAIMAVPAHDERDFEFCTRYGINIRPVVRPATPAPEVQAGAFTEYGILQDSGEYSGLPSEVARKEMAARADHEGFGKAAALNPIQRVGYRH